MTTSGCCFGSVTTLAIRVWDHRSNVAAWHRLQVRDPTYVRSPRAVGAAMPGADAGAAGTGSGVAANGTATRTVTAAGTGFCRVSTTETKTATIATTIHMY